MKCPVHKELKRPGLAGDDAVCSETSSQSSSGAYAAEQSEAHVQSLANEESREESKGDARESGTSVSLAEDYPMLRWPKGKIPVWRQALFGFPFLGYYAIIYMNTSFMKLFYIDDYPHASLGLLTFFTVLALLVDAFSDPFIANLTDTARPRCGRRRPFIVVGGILQVFTCTLSYIPLLPPGLGASIWYGIFHIMNDVVNTVVCVPLEGWGAEMTPDCRERSDLWIWREFALVVGILIGTAAPSFLGGLGGLDCSETPGDGCIGYPVLSAGFGLIQLVAILLLVFLGAERPNHRLPAPSPKGTWCEDDRVPSLMATWLNRPFRILTVGAVTESFGMNMPFAIMPFYARIVLGSACMKPSLQFSLLAVVNLVSRLLFLPAWIFASRRLGKFRTYFWFNYLLVLSSGLFITVGKDTASCGQLYLGCALVAFWGIVYAGYTFLKSVIADIVDYDEFLSGRRREGQYMMTMTFLPKFLAIPSQAMPFLLMAYLGYQRPPETGQDAEQPEAVILLLKLCVSIVPACSIFIGALVLLWYPTHAWSDASHKRIIDAIKYQHARGLPAEDPWFPGRLVPPPPAKPGVHDGILSHFLPAELKAAVRGEEANYRALQLPCLMWASFGLLLLVPGVALLVVGWHDLGDDLGASVSPLGLLFIGVTVLLVWFHGVRLQAAWAAERLRVPRADLVARYNFLCRYTGDTPLDGAGGTVSGKLSHDGAPEEEVCGGGGG